VDPRTRPDWPEAFYLLTYQTRLSCTLEAPSDFPLPVRVEALAAATVRTRSYAKRQQTWFRRIAGARRLDALDARTALALAELARGLKATD
jgi:hypothetical protein